MYELDLLAGRHRRAQVIADRRSALSAWILANIHRDTAHKPEAFRFEDVVQWLGTGFHETLPVPPVPAAPPPLDELTQRLDAVHLLHKELYGAQGPGALEEG